MLVSNNKVLKINSKWLKAQVLYYITLVQPTGGTITASTLVATPGTLITLSNVSDTGYTFDSYTINGEPIVGNTFILGDEDVIVSANYIHNILSVNVIQSTGGTVTATPVTGYYGTEVTLTVETASGYIFDSYSVTGTTIINDKFIIGEEDVYIKPNYEVNYNPLNLPPYTIRLLYDDGVTPTFSYGSGVQVSSSPNIWDLTYNNVSWERLLVDHRAGEKGELLEVLGANSSGVTNMLYMFAACTSLRKVALFDISNSTNIKGMFSNCWSLTSIPLFDTSNITNFDEFCYDCRSLTEVPLFDTSNATSFASMFEDCSSLTSIPIFNTSNVTNFVDTFEGCSSLTSLPLIDTSNATNMQGTFARCSSITTIPLYDTSNVNKFDGIFQQCTLLETIPLLNTSKATTVNTMFMDCNNVESGALALYQQMSTQTNPPTSHNYTFTRCGNNTTTGAAELAQIPSSWGGTGA